jgi:hypothetical protein
MANSQMLISKKPSEAAKDFRPLVTQIVRTVHRVTTQVSARKTSTGKIDSSPINGAIKEETISPPQNTAETQLSRRHGSNAAWIWMERPSLIRAAAGVFKLKVHPTVGRSWARCRLVYGQSGGKLVLTLESAEERRLSRPSPLDPELITQAETVEEAHATRPGR